MPVPFTAGWQTTDVNPLVIEKSEGSYVYEINGTMYLDSLAGLFCTALGGSEPRLVDAATRQLKTLPFYHSFWNRIIKPALDLAEALLDMFITDFVVLSSSRLRFATCLPRPFDHQLLLRSPCFDYHWDSAYFIAGLEILSWINSTLHLNLSKVEEGLHSVHHIDDLNFDARNDNEMIQNYNVLQDFTNKMNITKCFGDEQIEVNRLIKGSPLDNLEFMQWMRRWMKRYCDCHNGGLINCIRKRGTSEREEQMVFVTTRLDEEIKDSKDGTY
ncbi:hypothetical protein OROMI_008345 [Orobanche minor]